MRAEGKHTDLRAEGERAKRVSLLRAPPHPASQMVAPVDGASGELPAVGIVGPDRMRNTRLPAGDALRDIPMLPAGDVLRLELLLAQIGELGDSKRGAGRPLLPVLVPAQVGLENVEALEAVRVEPAPLAVRLAIGGEEFRVLRKVGVLLVQRRCLYQKQKQQRPRHHGDRARIPCGRTLIIRQRRL